MFFIITSVRRRTQCVKLVPMLVYFESLYLMLVWLVVDFRVIA